MFFYVASRTSHGLFPYNCAVSADEALIFVAESRQEGLEAEVLDEEGRPVTIEQLTAASDADANAR